MGQSSSKKQKKSKTKDKDFSRSDQSRQSNKRIKTNNLQTDEANLQTKDINARVKEINLHNDVKSNVNSKQNEYAENLHNAGAKTDETSQISAGDNRQESPDPRHIRYNGNMVPPQYLQQASHGDAAQPKSSADLDKIEVDSALDTSVESNSEDLLNNKHIITKFIAHERSTGFQADSVLEPVVVVRSQPKDKLVRSSSTNDTSDVHVRNAPVRRLSVRESTEFRRKQFYQQILSNQSQFDSDHLLSRHSADSPMPVKFSKEQLDTLRSFYSYRSEIKKYDADDYPDVLRKYALKLDKIEKDVSEMSNSQINLYFATIKDDLHNNWRKIFTERVEDSGKAKKVELITRIKTALDVLNNRYLKRKFLFVKY